MASLAAAGLVAGWAQRAVIVRYAVLAGEPPLRSCPACGQQLLAVRQMARPPIARCPACGERTGPPPLGAVPLAFTDAAVRRLPDVLTYPALVGTVLLLIVASAAGGDWAAMARAALGTAALSGFPLVLALISPSGMGLGDVKAAAALGTLLAWRGWPALLVGGFAGFLLAALYGTALLITRHATRKHHIPLGPFMITGAWVCVKNVGGFGSWLVRAMV